MKIGPLETSSVTTAIGERKTGATTRPVTAGGTAGAGVDSSTKVELSSVAAHLTSGSSDGVFDAQKVQDISNAIRDGNFKVNPEAIADKLIANAQELLGNVGKR